MDFLIWYGYCKTGLKSISQSLEPKDGALTIKSQNLYISQICKKEINPCLMNPVVF